MLEIFQFFSSQTLRPDVRAGTSWSKGRHCFDWKIPLAVSRPRERRYGGLNFAWTVTGFDSARLMTGAEKYFHPGGNRTYAIYLSTALNIYSVCIFYFYRSHTGHARGRARAAVRACTAGDCSVSVSVWERTCMIHTYTFILYLKRSRGRLTESGHTGVATPSQIKWVILGFAQN